MMPSLGFANSWTVFSPAGDSTLEEILQNLRFITDRMKQEDADTHIMDEWKALGRVVDRLFFWVVCLILIVTTIAMMLQRDANH